MAKNDMLRALNALLDTEPRKLDLRIVIVNPSGAGSWLAGTDLGGVRVFGAPGDDPTGAVRNLFDKLTASRGYREDGDIQVALEMVVAGKKASDLFASASSADELGAGDDLAEALDAAKHAASGD